MKNLLKKALLPVLAPLIVLVCFEAFARLVFLDIKVIYQLHPEYLYVTKANFSRAIFNKRTDEKIFFHTSALGYRGNFAVEKTKPRIMVYGDSNVQALFENEENTFSFQLATALKNKNRDFEAINAGTSGYGPDQNLLRMRNDLPVFKPDAVVLQIFADNDYGDLLRNKLFSAEENRLVERKPELSLKIKAGYFCAQSYICRSLHKIARDIKTKDEKPGETEEALLEISRQEYRSYQKNNTVDFPMWEDTYDQDLKSAPASDSAQAKVKLMKALIQEIKKTGAAHPEIKIILLIQPAKKDLWELDPDPPYSVKILEQEAKRAGLEYVNLYRPYLQAGPQEMYNDYDNHWSPEGQRVAALLVSDRISAL